MDRGRYTFNGIIVPIVFSSIAGIPTVICSIYCLVIWAPMVDEFTWLNPDISLICWTFCSTGKPVLAYIAMAAGILSVLGGITFMRHRAGRYLLAVTGILLLPIGLLNFLILKRRWSGTAG
jgi:hypothetical protein